MKASSGDALVKFALAMVNVAILAGVRWTVKWWSHATNRQRLGAAMLWAVGTLIIYAVVVMALG